MDFLLKLLLIRKENKLEKLRILLQLSQKPSAEVHSAIHVLHATRDDLMRLVGIRVQLLPQDPPDKGISTDASLLRDLSDGQGLVVFNQNSDMVDVLLSHHGHFTARSLWLMNTSICLKPLNEPLKLTRAWYPGLGNTRILFPEPSANTDRATERAVLEDNLLFLLLSKEAII